MVPPRAPSFAFVHGIARSGPPARTRRAPAANGSAWEHSGESQGSTETWGSDGSRDSARFRHAFVTLFLAGGSYVVGAVNSVALIGNLATGVELKELGEGRSVASFVVAVDRARRDGGVDFVRIAVWNKQAQGCARELSKGERIGVDGRLRSRSWDDAQGRRRTVLEVVANHVEFLGRPASATVITDGEAPLA